VCYGSLVAVPLHYVHQLPVVAGAFKNLLPTIDHRHWRWRWLDTFDWYTPRYQWKHRYPEVPRWCRESGFTDLYVADEPVCVRGVKT
jgi:hypothetical protein